MRPIRTIIIACGVATLTACSLTNNSDDNPPANPAATAESTTAQQDSEAHPPKDVTIGEMLNAGVYAPDSTAYGLFRPCGGDISLPQLQEIGWKVDSISNNQNDLENINVNRLEDITGSSFYCFLKGIPGKQLGSGHLSVNYKSYEEVTQLEGVRETREDLNKLNVKRPAGYYIHDAESSTTNSDKVQRCSAGVMTKRGRITFDYQSPFTDTSTTGKEKVCQTAVDSLQTILDMPITAAPAANPAPEPAPAPESEAPTTPVKPAAHAVAAGPELKFQPSPGFPLTPRRRSKPPRTRRSQKSRRALLPRRTQRIPPNRRKHRNHSSRQIPLVRRSRKTRRCPRLRRYLVLASINRRTSFGVVWESLMHARRSPRNSGRASDLCHLMTPNLVPLKMFPLTIHVFTAPGTATRSSRKCWWRNPRLIP